MPESPAQSRRANGVHLQVAHHDDVLVRFGGGSLDRIYTPGDEGGYPIAGSRPRSARRPELQGAVGELNSSATRTLAAPKAIEGSAV